MVNTLTNISNGTIPFMPVLFDLKLKLVEQIVLASIFVLALIANTIVLVVMLKARQRRCTRMAFFILHLTIADLLVAFFSVLPMLIWKSTTTFVGGDFLCRIVTFLMLTVTYISVYTLVLMAIDRYKAIVYPLSIYTWTPRSGFLHMAGVWCVSLLLASPQLAIFRTALHPALEKMTCMAKFPGPGRTWELIYIVWTILLQFVLPIGILIFCYGSVYYIVNRNFAMYRASDSWSRTSMMNLPSIGRTKRGSSPSSKTGANNISMKSLLNSRIHVHYPSLECSSVTTVTFFNKPASVGLRDTMYPVIFRLRRASHDSTANNGSSIDSIQSPRQHCRANHFLSRARLKTIKLTFIVVLAYVLCSTPFYIGSIIMALHGKFISQKTMNWMMTIFSLLFNLNSCSNPIICLTLSGTLFRRSSADHKRQQQQQQQSRRSQTINDNLTKDNKIKAAARHSFPWHNL